MRLLVVILALCAAGKVATSRSDLYSLGVVLYHLLTGRPPFQGPTAMDILVQVVSEDPVPVRALLEQGTGADRQLAVFDQNKSLVDVVDLIHTSFLAGL